MGVQFRSRVGGVFVGGGAMMDFWGQRASVGAQRAVPSSSGCLRNNCRDEAFAHQSLRAELAEARQSFKRSVITFAITGFWERGLP